MIRALLLLAFLCGAEAAAAQPRAQEPDIAYGAYQRGLFMTAFLEATKRAPNDPKAMALLGELYANGLGVPRNDGEAARWFQLASQRGDREATFAIAMFYFQGRGVKRDRDTAAKLLADAARQGQPAA
ncbi:MAG: sel1 repeat family protein, partial [Pseudolabrys sp.]|nr:sel1 repeat family protein [Pseudolabrys sp.]